MAKDIVQTPGVHVSHFERIKHTEAKGNEFWESRDLAVVLDYTQYRNFEAVIEKAKLACLNSGHRIEDHFADVSKMIEIGKGGRREVKVTLLSRYACYLVVQNADPTKEIVAHGKMGTGTILYRSTKECPSQTRISHHERHKMVPVPIFPVQNHGYMGLYGGLTQGDIHRRKGLKKSPKILDHMGSTELAANLFRATQAEDKLRREGVKGKDAANRTHHEVGAKARQKIVEQGGTIPEELLVVDSIKQLEAKQRK